MVARQFSRSADHVCTSFRPIVLYESQLDPINDSLTLSQSRKEHCLDFDMPSTQELDDIDAQCSVQDQDRNTTDSNSNRSLQERGYAVNDVMFDYRALGSLRSELVPIRLFGRWHAGLAASALASGIAAAILRDGYRPLLSSTIHDDRKTTFDQDVVLLNWGIVLSVFLGLLSDCVPLYGTRRKAYMVLGWVLSTLSFASIWAIHVWESVHEEKKSNAVMKRLLECFQITGSTSLHASWVAALALVVEFGQREAMSERGGLAAWILILSHLGALCAHMVVAELHSSLTLLNTSAIIVLVSVLVLPLVLWLLYEDDEQGSTATLIASTKQIGVVPALRTGILQLWEICREIVTHRVLLFLLLYGMLLDAHDPRVAQALASWSGFASNEARTDPWLLVTGSGGTLSALVYAKWRLLRAAWRQVALAGIGLTCVTVIVQAIVIATDTIRAKWFYAISMVLKTWPTSWLLLFTVLATTEIAHVGCEGVTIGLVLSCQAIGTTATMAVAEWINYPPATQSAIIEDSHTTRARVLFAAMTYAAVNVVAAATVPLLPRSKLETQQLRIFGGQDRKGAALIVVLFVVLLVFAIVKSVMV